MKGSNQYERFYKNVHMVRSYTCHNLSVIANRKAIRTTMLASTIKLRACSFSRIFMQTSSVRPLSANASDASDASKNAKEVSSEEAAPTKKAWVRPTSPDQVSVLGKQYNDLIFKGREGRPLGLADLRRLLQQCNTPDHVKYAVGAVEYFQIKGQDFAEDVNSLFVKACIKGENPMAAAKIISKVTFILFIMFF